MNEGERPGRHPISDERADAYRARREALLAAVSDLDDELAAVSEQSEPDVQRLERALVDVRETFARHVEESEAEDGLLAQIVDASPALMARSEQLRREHGELTATADELARAAGTGRGGDELLDAGRDLSARLDAHRHRGTELLLDAYMLDISVGD